MIVGNFERNLKGTRICYRGRDWNSFHPFLVLSGKEGCRKIPVIGPGIRQLRKDFSVSKLKIFRQGSVILANVVWLHENNFCKGHVTCLYREGGIIGIMFCHQTGGPITVWAYKREGL